MLAPPGEKLVWHRWSKVPLSSSSSRASAPWWHTFHCLSHSHPQKPHCTSLDQSKDSKINITHVHVKMDLPFWQLRNCPGCSMWLEGTRSPSNLLADWHSHRAGLKNMHFSESKGAQTLYFGFGILVAEELAMVNCKRSKWCKGKPVQHSPPEKFATNQVGSAIVRWIRFVCNSNTNICNLHCVCTVYEHGANMYTLMFLQTVQTSRAEFTNGRMWVIVSKERQRWLQMEM